MLIDDLRPVLEQEGDPHAPGLPYATVFLVDNVANYLHSLDDRTLPPQALPNVAPLAPLMWFEVDGTRTGRPHWKFGCFVVVFDRCLETQQKARIWRDMAPLSDDVRWIFVMPYYAADYSRTTHADIAFHIPHWEYLLEVRHDGRMAGFHSNEHQLLRLRGMEADPENRYTWHEEIETALTALCFAHCRGVTLLDHQPPRQQRRAAERKGHPAPVTYKTLDIGPVTRVLRDEGHSEEIGVARALHLVRAHFAHYTPDKPLFGKIAGTFYVPMHARGRREQGLVLKDYNITPGATVE